MSAPMTLAAALVRLRQYSERTSTWSTATYNNGTEKALHEIALTLAAEVDRLSDELTGRSLALYEEELDTARLRLALASAQRGRRELRAQVADQVEAYPGELVMLRGLLAVLRVTAKHSDMDEVRRLLAEHSSDEQASYAALPDVHPPHPAPCRHPASPDCTCPAPAPRDLRPGAEAARRMLRDRQDLGGTDG